MNSGIDIGLIRGLITVIVFVLFIGIWVWSWSRKRKQSFEAASLLPLEDDSSMPGTENHKEPTP